MILHRPYCGNHQPSMASGTLRCVWQSVTMSPFHLFRVSLLSAYKQTDRVLFPALPKWTVWPGSHQKPEVSVLIFLPPRHITMTTDIEITSSPGKKAWVTSHSGTFVVHEESRVHSGEPVKDEYSASEEERSGWTERGGGRGLGERAVMQIQPLNSPAGKRKVTNSFIPKIANEFDKS